MFQDRVLVRIDIYKRGLLTLAGIGVGDPELKVFRFFRTICGRFEADLSV